MWSRGGGGGVGQEKVDRRPPTDRLQTPGSVGPCSSFKFKFKVGAAAAIAARLQKLQLQDRRAAALAAAVGTRTVFHHFWSWLRNMVVSDRPPHSLKSSLVVATVFVFLSRTESSPIIRIPQLLQVNKGWWPLTSRFVRKDSEDEDDGKKTTLDWLGGGWVGGTPTCTLGLQSAATCTPLQPPCTRTLQSTIN